MVVSLLPALVLTVVAQWWSSAAVRLPSGVGRFGPAGAFAVLQPGALPGFHFLDARVVDAPPAAWLQLGVATRTLVDVTGISALDATRAVQVVVALIGVALVWRIVRRMPSSAVASFAAAVAGGVAPMAVAVHAESVPIGIAVVWLLGAAAVAQSRPAPVRVVAVGVCTAVAVLTAPWAVLGAVAPLWLLVRSARLRVRRPVRAVVLVVPVIVLVLAGAVGIGAALQRAPAGGGAAALDRLAAAASALAPSPSVGVAAWRTWATLDPVGLLVGVLALAVAVPRRRLTPIVVTSLLIAVAAVVPLGHDPVTTPALLLPAMAILTGAAVDRAIALLGRPAFATSVVGAGWLTGVAALLVVAAVQWGSGIGGAAGESSRPAGAVRQWLRTSVPAGQVVVVSLATWPDLATGARSAVGWYAADTGRPDGERTSVPWTTADYVVSDAQLREAASGQAAAVLRRSVAIRTFGSGSSALQVRAVPAAAGTTPPASRRPAPSAAERAATADRIRVGTELARNPRIVLRGADRARLRTGQVDQRVVVVLGQLLAVHTVTVAGFPAVHGEPPRLRRQVLIGALDGRAVPADIQRTGILLRYLSSLRDGFSTSRIDATPNGVLATFDAAHAP